MKKLVVYALLLLSSLPTLLPAEVFKYLDKDGGEHYVTDSAKIPAEYRNQSQAARALPGLSRYQHQEAPSRPAPASTRAYTRPIRAQKVDVFVTSWCPYCKRLEAFLKEKQIQFTRYDIEHDSKGMLMHHQLGGGGVPVTKIGNTVVRGFSPDSIMQALGR